MPTDFFVSFVVPCYNVEKYISRCLNSICNQSGALFEVICIDDGSTDNTGIILNKYKIKYNNLKVIKQNNLGLATARNTGVDAARGKYISFVDGDDVISPNYLKYMYLAAANASADLVVSNLTVFTDGRLQRLQQKWSQDNSLKTEIIEESNIGSAILEERLSCSACGKLIKYGLCKTYPFIDGKYYEDVDLISKIYLSSNLSILINNSLYGYYMRQNSITHQQTPSKKQMYDLLSSYSSMEKTIEDAGCFSFSALVCHKIITVCRFHDLRNRYSNPSEFLEQELELIQYISLHLCAKDIPKSLLYRFILLKHFPRIYDSLYNIYNKYYK